MFSQFTYDNTIFGKVGYVMLGEPGKGKTLLICMNGFYVKLLIIKIIHSVYDVKYTAALKY